MLSTLERIFKSHCWRIIATLVVLGAAPVSAEEEFETVEFPSGDGLEITADLYASHPPNAPFIVLFHQAGWSRGEYRETAPRLNTLGFNCMAVDQRSGKTINGVTNMTAQKATTQGLATQFTDAIPDMLAAIAYVREHYHGKVIGWGSSYSSALILKLAGEQADLVDGVLSFSPGEYFGSNNFIKNGATGLVVPTFVTSARSEQVGWSSIVDGIPDTTEVVTFVPKTTGNHGSRALWSQFGDSAEYWTAVESFLARWQVPENTKDPVLNLDRDQEGNLILSFQGTQPSPGETHLLQASTDLRIWRTVGPIEDSEDGPTEIPLDDVGPFSSAAWFRVAMATLEADDLAAAVVSVTASGNPGSYSFSVGVSSPDTGCEQYADWWEVLDAEGRLRARRLLAHSHVGEQPFVRSGNVSVDADEQLWIRVHMNSGGYGSTVFSGSVESGFSQDTLSPLFMPLSAVKGDLPDSCGF